MTKHGQRYTEDEVKLLDWIASKIDTPQEMTDIAPRIAKVMDRGESAIRQQIEDRKQAQGRSDFFYART